MMISCINNNKNNFEIMDSRIQKLFSLLSQDSSSPGLRRSSAKQLSIICNTHKDEVLPLVFKLIIPVLFSQNGEARSSAAFFLSQIENFDRDSIEVPSLESLIKDLDLQKEAEERDSLLASRGNEYEVGKTDLKQQRQQVKNVLSVVPGIDSLSESIVEDKDLEVEQSLSPRERSALKRKVRQLDSQARKSPLVEQTLISVDQPLLPQIISILDDSLLSPNWWVRLGALMGIKSLFENSSLIIIFLKNLLFLLALDCFVDFDSGDTTSAPVREEAGILLFSMFSLIKNSTLRLEISQKFDFMLSSTSWNHSLTCFIIFSKIAELLDEIPEKVSESISKLATTIDVELVDEEILSNILGLLIVFSSHPSFDKSKIDSSCICTLLIEYLPKCEDISSLPSQIFNLVQHLGQPFSSNPIIPFLRHCNKSVRTSAIQLIKASLEKNLTQYSDTLSQQLFQVLLFEDDTYITNLSHEIIQKYDSGNNWGRWIKIISVSIDKPFIIDNLYEFRLRPDGSLETIPKSVPNWELGWKAADIMILSSELIWKRRKQAANVIKIPEAMKSQVLATLQNSNQGFHKILAYWLGFDVKVNMSFKSFREFQSDSKVDTELTSTIWELRIKAIERSITLEEIGKILSLEPLECLRDNFACDAAKTIDSDPALSKILLEFDSSFRVWKNCQRKKEIYEQIKRDKIVYLARFLSGSDYQISKEDLNFISERILKEFDSDFIVRLIISLLEMNYSFEEYLVSDSYLDIFERYPNQFIRLIKTLLEKELINEILPAFIPLTLSIMTNGLDLKAPFCFSQMMKLSSLSDSKLSAVQKGLDFIKNLSNPSLISSKTNPPSKLKITLREYQKEGFQWLIFLQENGLHGALCDDMGLGKTLQTLCALVYSLEQGQSNLPSLVVCPSSLTVHWQRECKTYFPHLKVEIYLGKDRRCIWNKPQNFNLIISSYDAVRNDIEHFQKQKFLYIILDEGHVIRNSKSKTSLAARSLSGKYRLILTGTPIQNNILELWTLFDFLMPGYLGTEQKTFIDKYAKPIMAVSVTAKTTNSNASVKDFEEAEKKLEALHKQVLPFILRRLKDQVLKELPPKIIQDYYCDLTTTQQQILSSFSESEEGEQALAMIHKMQLLCVHPKLLNGNGGITDEEIFESPKMSLLRDLIIECGLDQSGEEEQGIDIDVHRLLIFAQHRGVLELAQRMIELTFPHLKLLKMDGNTPAKDRADQAHRFNTDSSINIFLLTTSVGGLGLNLTGADTVIFLQHDWNPQRDLQAMDRAHRLGQKRTVNIYRLITKNSLEERIMGLQSWKVRVAKTVVSQQNASIKSMGEAGDILGLLASSVEQSEEILKTNKEDEEIEKMLKTIGGKASLLNE
jgi:SNF2 family DNA or RNA helicase